MQTNFNYYSLFSFIERASLTSNYFEQQNLNNNHYLRVPTRFCRKRNISKNIIFLVIFSSLTQSIMILVKTFVIDGKVFSSSFENTTEDNGTNI